MAFDASFLLVRPMFVKRKLRISSLPEILSLDFIL